MIVCNAAQHNEPCQTVFVVPFFLRVCCHSFLGLVLLFSFCFLFFFLVAQRALSRVNLRSHAEAGGTATGELGSELGVLLGDLDLCSRGFGV